MERNRYPSSQSRVRPKTGVDSTAKEEAGRLSQESVHHVRQLISTSYLLQKVGEWYLGEGLRTLIMVAVGKKNKSLLSGQRGLLPF